MSITNYYYLFFLHSKVLATEPRDRVVRISSSTKISFRTQTPKENSETVRIDTNDTRGSFLCPIGGYEHAKSALREVLLLPRTHPQLFTSLGISAPTGLPQ